MSLNLGQLKKPGQVRAKYFIGHEATKILYSQHSIFKFSHVQLAADKYAVITF